MMYFFPLIFSFSILLLHKCSQHLKLVLIITFFKFYVLHDTCLLPCSNFSNKKNCFCTDHIHSSTVIILIKFYIPLCISYKTHPFYKLIKSSTSQIFSCKSNEQHSLYSNESKELYV